MIEFESGSFRYRAERLGAFAQFHVLRRMASASVGDILEVVEKLGEVGGMDAVLDGRVPMTAFVSVIEPIIKSVGRMSDSDSEYVINSCLAVVTRQQGGGAAWAPVMVGGRLMFADIDMPTMLALTFQVLQDNLTSFFNALPTAGATVGGMTTNGRGSQAVKTG